MPINLHYALFIGSINATVEGKVQPIFDCTAGSLDTGQLTEPFNSRMQMLSTLGFLRNQLSDVDVKL